MITIELPFPPSVNTYWRKSPRGMYIAKKGKEFRSRVVAKCIDSGLYGRLVSGRVAVDIDLYPPDRRRRDIDNYLKGLLDSLTHSKLWVDDEQIDVLTVQRMTVERGGRCVVAIKEIDSE